MPSSQGEEGLMSDLVVAKNKLSIPMEVIVPKILELGFFRKPMEACGVVIPEMSAPPDQWVHELTNRSPDPRMSYQIDPATVAQLLSNKEVWGDVLIWHTHPSGMVGPSRGDMHERIEGLHYLVVSLPRGEAVTF